MPNHLASETSPYLLQHAGNPVDWYPWGAEALALSREGDRPIFLSIGYSACHWCHVMEHESFENHEIANLLNQWFVCIKVDREERPDLDQIYMSAVQAMTGSGGWPMSVFLTPELKPFFGGTYWPPTAQRGRAGFREILASVRDAWIQRRPAVEDQANELTQHLRELAESSVPPTALTDGLLQNAMDTLLRVADRVNGGFGSAPKFPHPMDLRLAMRCWKRFARASAPAEPSATKPSAVLGVAILTLEKMARGGIYDHLGGGFARYSTDERWLVPHFEKMLYDNAQLVPAYLEAFQITGRTEFSRVARETLDYVLREMTQPEGGFFSTQDADSEGVEGKFFVWSEAEVDAALANVRFPDPIQPISNDSIDPASIFKRVYDVTSAGNWERANILNRPVSEEQAAKSLGLDLLQLETILTECRKVLFDVRSQRVWPGRDDKVLASWNGLMISAMAMGASVLNEPRFAEAAMAAADFVLREMIQPDGIQETLPPTGGPTSPGETCRLWRAYKDGRARFNAYLDDYASLIDGLCELYQTVFDTRYLEAAVGLAERMIEQFWDSEGGGFFYTSVQHETLIARNKETQDNATPSGNSLAAMGLLKLSRLTGRTDFEVKAVATLEMMSGQIERSPLSAGLSLMALDFLLGPTPEIILAQVTSCDEGSTMNQQIPNLFEGREAFVRLHERFVPNKLIHWRADHLSDERIPEVIADVVRGKRAQRGQTTAYICHHGKCSMPVVGELQWAARIDQL